MPDLIYHYTGFEKLQCILEYSTLRFKESTKSNDILDTIGFVNILQSMPKFNSPSAEGAFLNFLLGYYQNETYKPSSVSLVSCFSKTPDSRLLWDAYTMHRPGNQKCPYGDEKYCFESSTKYNGVCIAFRQDKLQQLLKKTEGIFCDKTHIQAIDYGDQRIRILLNNWLKEAVSEMWELSKDPDQSQNIIPTIPVTSKIGLDLRKSLVIPMLHFMQKVEAYSPFYKHEFWNEEMEVRASLLITNGRLPNYKDISQYDDGSKYCDISITPDCIDHFILGPEFDDQNLSEIKQHTEYKLNICDFELKKSLGTGVIRNN